MKKMVSLICGFLALSVVSVATAQELQIEGESFKQWYVQGDVGYAFPDNSTIDHDNTGVFGVRLGRLLTENIAVEAQYRYNSYDLSNNDVYGDSPVTGSKIKAAQFLCNAKLGAMIFTDKEKFYPYVLAGVGYSFNDWTGTVERTGVTSSSTFDMDDSFIMQGAIGIDYYPSNDFAINLELSRIWSEPDATIKEANGTVSTGDLDIGYTSITVGFRMMF